MAEKCSYCGEEGHSIQQCPKWKGAGREEMLPVREEDGRVSFIPVKVRKATFEQFHYDTVLDALNVAYNTFVESPPRMLHEENVDKFQQFSRHLFEAQKMHGVDVEKFRHDFEEHLQYYLKFVKQLKGLQHSSESSSPKRVFVSPAAIIPGGLSEAVVKESEIPMFTPAFLGEVQRAWREKRSTSFWDWLMEPVENGVTVTLRGTKKPHEFFPKDIIERMKYDSTRQVYVVTPKPFKKWRVWFTTPMGFERFIDVEAMTEEEARTKATPQAPPGSEYRYAAVQE